LVPHELDARGFESAPNYVERCTARLAYPRFELMHGDCGMYFSAAGPMQPALKAETRALGHNLFSDSPLLVAAMASSLAGGGDDL
jgi:hypothetical protein